MTDRELQIVRAALDAAAKQVRGSSRSTREGTAQDVVALDPSTIVGGVPLSDDLICPVCGSDSNERDEFIKAEREIERLHDRIADYDNDILRRFDPAAAESTDLFTWISCQLANIERLRYRVAELERELQREKAELDALGGDMVDGLIDASMEGK